KLTPLRFTVEFGLVTVKVRLVVPFSGMFAAPNDFAIVGGATTVMLALPVEPVPPFAAETLPVTLFLTPAVGAVTVTLRLQEVLVGRVRRLREIMSGAVVVRVPPPQTVELPLATVRPAGKVSVKATPVNAVVVFGFDNVNVNTLVPLSGIVAASKDFIIDGGPTTVSCTGPLLPPSPLSF